MDEVQPASPESLTPINSIVKVTISPDLVEARLIIYPPQNGGSEVTPKMIDSAIKGANIQFGIDKDLLIRLRCCPEYSKEFVIAKGIPAVNGTDGTIQYFFKTSADMRPKIREDGTVDYRELGLINNVKKGQVLCRMTLPEKGSEGMTVTGRIIHQVRGRPVSSPNGKNTLLSDDQTVLTAAIDGQVSLVGTRVNVLETFIVGKDVDNSTGNIKFIGNVSVYGNIREGFLVEAGGDVEVDGFVEGGIIKAGGNVTVRGGIVGMNRGRIECKGNLSSLFLENCEVDVDGKIDTESVMNCSVKCGQSLELSGSRAKIVGGRCIVGENITADSIGSTSNLDTELILGTDPEILTRYRLISNEIGKLQAQIPKLNQIIHLLSKYEQANQLNQTKKKMLDSSRLSLNEFKAKLQAYMEESDLINKKIEKSGKGKVICKNNMYGGVRLTIGSAHLDIDETISSSIFINQDGVVKISPLFDF